MLKLINAYSSIALTVCYLSDELKSLKDDNSTLVKNVKHILKESRDLHSKLNGLIKHYNR